MPSLTLEDSSTTFFYLDSGKPYADVYTSLVMLHGHTFHSGTFRRLLPLAPSKGLRLICVNRKDYAPTSLYSDADLKVIAEGTDEELTAFVEARGVEIAGFLYQLIDELSLPAPTADGKNGGIALLGWSMGNFATLSTIAATPLFSEKVHQRLEQYLRSFIMYSAPTQTLGIPDPPRLNTPLTDETIPPEQRGPAFAEWVAGFYTHGDLSTQDVGVLNNRTQDVGTQSTILGMAPEEFMSIVDFTAGPHSEDLLLSKYSMLANQMHKGLFDRNIRDLWPKLDFWFICGEKEPWPVHYGVWKVSQGANANGTEVKKRMIPGANHFLVWENPEKALEEFSNCLSSE